MTFDHDFGYSFMVLKKEGREKKNKVAKIVIKSHAFLLNKKIDPWSTYFSKILKKFHLAKEVIVRKQKEIRLDQIKNINLLINTNYTLKAVHRKTL